MSSPTQLSLAMLRDRGFTVTVVEYWHAFAKIKVDLWGIGDILAIKDDTTLLVQTTSGSNVAARITKINESKHRAALLRAGWLLHVHGWRKAKGRWICREVDLSEGDKHEPDQ